MPHYIIGGGGGGGGGGSGAASVDILTFTNTANLAEKGTGINNVTLRWTYKGIPDSQSIDQGIGSLNVSNRTYVYSQNISVDKIFTLTAMFGAVSLMKSTSIRFVDPIFIGAVTSAAPVEAEILGMQKRVADAVTFNYDLIVSDKRSAIAVPKSFSPLREIRESLFGLNIMHEFNFYDNVALNVTSGSVLYGIYIFGEEQHTGGFTQTLQFVF